jgi:lambda family phage tail tape measure protein
MPPSGTDNVDIKIQALVKGLADVRALVAEITKLPAAGAGASELGKEFADIQKQIHAAREELKGVGNDLRTSFAQVAQGANASRGVSTATKTARKDMAELSQGAAAMGRAFNDAMQGNVLGVLQSVSTALRTSVNLKDFFGEGALAIRLVGKELTETERLVTRFTGVLGTAAKNPAGKAAKNLAEQFGINAAQALTEPQKALDTFIQKLATMPDATERAAAAASVFGASTGKLLPVIEQMIAEQDTLVASTQAVAVAQEHATAATETLAAAQTQLAAAETSVEAVQASSTATTEATAAAQAELLAATEAVVAAETELAAAETAVVAATEAQIVAQETLAATEAEVADAADTATTATVGLGTAATVATAGILGILAAAGGAVLAAYGIVKSYSDAGSVIHDLGEKSGLAAEDVSALKLAAEQGGADLESAASSFQKYLRTVNEAAGGNKEAAATMKQLGIDTKTASDNSTNALEQLFKALHNIPPGAQQVDAAMKAAGKSGASLIPIVNQVNGDFAAFKKRAEELGVVLSQDDVNAADNFGDSMTELGAVVGSIRNTVGKELLPTILDLAKSLEQFIIDNKQGIADLASAIGVAINFCIGIFYALGGTIGFLANLIYALITVGMALISNLIAVGETAIKTGAAVAQFISGDIAGAMDTMTAAANQSRVALASLVDELNRAKTIATQPTFTSFFKFLNGGDGSTPKTFDVPKPKPTGSFHGGGGGAGKKKGQSDAKAYSDAILAMQKAQYEAEKTLLEDSIKTEQEILKEKFSQNLIGYQTYYDQLNASQLKENQVQLDYQRKLLALEQKAEADAKKGSDRVKKQTDILKINTEIEKLERNKENIVRRTTLEVQKQAKAYSDMMADIKNQLEDLEGDKGKAAADRIDKGLRDQLEKAQARAQETGDDSDVKRILHLKELLTYQARAKTLEDEINDAVKDRDQLEESLNNKVAQGLITREQANQQLATYEGGQKAQIDDLLAAMDGFANRANDPKLKQAVTDIKLQLQKWDIGQVNRQVDALKSQLDQAQGQLDVTLQDIDTATTNGALNEQQAYQQRQAAIQSYSEKALQLLAVLDGIAQATHNADLQAYVDKARSGIAQMQADGDDLAKNINQGFIGAFTDLFSGIAEGAKSAKEVFADFAKSILKMLTDIAIKIIVTKIAMAAFGGATGGAGGLGGILSGLFGGDKAVGGKGFASGGYTGDGGKNQMAGVVHGREFVINADATARNYALLEDINSGLNPRRDLTAGSTVSPAAALAGSSNGKNMKIVNVLPNDLLDNYISQSAGESTLLNFIENNAGAISQRLKQAS